MGSIRGETKFMGNESLVQLVENARGGCRDSMDQLTVQIQDELYRYIYRLTLNEDLANDIRQETLLQMCRTLSNLRESDRFKPWMYKTAWGKVKNHYRANKNKRHMSLNDSNNLIDALQSRCTEGLKALVSNEIAETMVRSMWTLDVKQKSVLVLRCYENLSYKQIAVIMNCSETSARVLFFRAKNNLRAKLRKKGIVTQTMFLGMLGLFGTVTSTAEAAVTVSASTLKTGTIGTVIGYLTSKFTAYLLSFVTGASLVVGGTVLYNNAQQDSLVHQNNINDVSSFHFIKQAWKDAYIPNANLLMGKSLSKGAYEQWFFFPEGVDGSMFKMTQRWDPQVKNKLCGWLLNEDGQHYYNSGSNTLYLVNTPLPKRKTTRFPSDSLEFCDFLDQMEGKEEGLEYKRDPETGLLEELIDHRFGNVKDFSSDIEFDILDEKTFGDFRYKWPQTPVFVDERDAIHKQEWTLFNIQGQINGTEISGKCQIPYIYKKCQSYPPLLKLHIDNQYSIIDCPSGAFVLDDNNKAIASYPSGSFFKGLVRPWFGLHTIDSVRRDAAECRVPFKLENLDFGGFYYQKRIVTLHSLSGYANLKIAITIDINKNEIPKIQFMRDDNTVFGSLEFNYPSDPTDITESIDMPDMKKGWFTNKEPMGIRWLFELAQGTLGQH